MKKFKNLSITIAALIIAQVGMNPVAFAVDPNSDAAQRVKVKREEMKQRIKKHLLQIKVFRPDLENTIDIALKELNKDASGAIHVKEEKSIKQIIEEDNFELLQKEVEKESYNMNIIVEDSFFEKKYMKIPILHYCAMKNAIKCFKFLILNGADPYIKLGETYNYTYRWDCMSVATCFGNLEMMKILEERGVNKFNNPDVWEAAALTHRNQILQLFISKKGEITNFEDCLKKAMFGAVRGNNLKGLKLLLKQGAKVNAVDEYDWNPLHFAALYDFVEVGKMLIDAGANVNAINNDRRGPLNIAVIYDSYMMKDLLERHGAQLFYEGPIPCIGQVSCTLDEKLRKQENIMKEQEYIIKQKDLQIEQLRKQLEEMNEEREIRRLKELREKQCELERKLRELELISYSDNQQENRLCFMLG